MIGNPSRTPPKTWSGNNGHHAQSKNYQKAKLLKWTMITINKVQLSESKVAKGHWTRVAEIFKNWDLAKVQGTNPLAIGFMVMVPLRVRGNWFTRQVEVVSVQIQALMQNCANIRKQSGSNRQSKQAGKASEVWQAVNNANLLIGADRQLREQLVPVCVVPTPWSSSRSGTVSWLVLSKSCGRFAPVDALF